MNYADAQLNCQNRFGNHGGKLFEPRRANTNQLVSAAAANFVSGTSDDFWLGINDLTIQGQYVYASDGQPVPVDMWQQHEPNSVGGCVFVFLRMTYHDASWYDGGCNGKQYSVCQEQNTGM